MLLFSCGCFICSKTLIASGNDRKAFPLSGGCLSSPEQLMHDTGGKLAPRSLEDAGFIDQNH